jgi:hypothetical protein
VSSAGLTCRGHPNFHSTSVFAGLQCLEAGRRKSRLLETDQPTLVGGNKRVDVRFVNEHLFGVAVVLAALTGALLLLKVAGF